MVHVQLARHLHLRRMVMAMMAITAYTARLLQSTTLIPGPEQVLDPRLRYRQLGCVRPTGHCTVDYGGRQFLSESFPSDLVTCGWS